MVNTKIHIRGSSFELLFYDFLQELVIQSKKSLNTMSVSLDKWLISSLREVLHLSNGKPTGGFLPHQDALWGCYKAFESRGCSKPPGLGLDTPRGVHSSVG